MTEPVVERPMQFVPNAGALAMTQNTAADISEDVAPLIVDAIRWRFPNLAELDDAAAYKEATAAYWRDVIVGHARFVATEEANATSSAAIEQATQDAIDAGAGIN